MPGMIVRVRGFDISSLLFHDASEDVNLEAQLQFFIDDGLPFERRLNLMDVLGPIIQAGWIQS
jgi:hypothetical protein